MATAAVANGAYARSVAEFEQWLDTAQPNDRFVLAEGETSPRAAPIWSFARASCDDGTVRLHHVQGDRPGWWQYIAVRRGLIEVGEPARVLRVEDDTDPAEKVLRVLRRAANFSRPCPSNAELAKACGLKDAGQASYQVRRLVQAGAIRVVSQGVGQARVIVIAGSGRRTAQAAG
jgi:hypothetical protein